jgi:hypothetical protein
LLAALVLLETAPSVPAAAMRRRVAHRCEIAATVDPVALVALPSQPTAGPIDSAGCARTPLAPWLVVPPLGDPARTDVASAVPRTSTLAGAWTWLHVHRQRARAPDDPDPS